MAFDRLKALGDARFDKILNTLMRGQPAMALARTIQQPPPMGWGEFQDVAEKTLTQQLNRLRMAMAEGAFGKQMAEKIAAGETPQVKALEHVSPRVLDRLEDLAEVQRERVVRLVEADKKKFLHAKVMSIAFTDYQGVLLEIQKVRFNLGLDEFKGPMPGMAAVRGTSVSTTFPDGTSTQKQVFEAVTTLEQIFEMRKIPKTIEHP